MRYWADPESGATSNVVYFTERFDPVEMAFLDRFVRPGDHVIDAGATGLYSLFLATLVGGDGRIDVFEAAPRSRRSAAKTALNGLLGTSALHEVAISDRIGELRFRGIATSRAMSLRPATSETTVAGAALRSIAHPRDRPASHRRQDRHRGRRGGGPGRVRLSHGGGSHGCC
jgi:FkbM family methyltransferase